MNAPGDKSVSHRALMLAGMAVGTTDITGLLEADDVTATGAAMGALGVEIERDAGTWRVHGRGIGGLVEPSVVLDFGNSGTGARLVAGLCASHPFTSFLTGDPSLNGRPMRRIIDPLSQMGARFASRSGDRLPMAIFGARDPHPIEYTLPMASAQVKSAILLAALNTAGETTVIEPQPTRDHTERLLIHFGADLRSMATNDGRQYVTLVGQPELIANGAIAIAGDFSSAAFPLVAALITPDSEITIAGVGINPTRIGLLETLKDMGADIAVQNRRNHGGEPVAEITVRSGPLFGIDVPADRVASMIDEFPILGIAAAIAHGKTRMTGLAELRVKESDRLAAIMAGLSANGVAVEAGDDWLVVHGNGGPPAGGGHVATSFDHRIAMAFLILGTAARTPITIDTGGSIATSFPNFSSFMNEIGARIDEHP